MKAKEVHLGEICPDNATNDIYDWTGKAKGRRLRELHALAGPLKLSAIAKDIEKSPLGDLLRKDRLVFRSGLKPVPGHEWQHVCGSYRWADDEATVCKNRREALRGVLTVLEELFEKKAKGANVKEWVLVALQGWWLREEVYQSVEGDSWIVVDSTLAFVPKDSDAL